MDGRDQPYLDSNGVGYYEPTIWKDDYEGIQEGTPVDEQNLNNIEGGVNAANLLSEFLTEVIIHCNVQISDILEKYQKKSEAADKAVHDGDGNSIVDTYIKKASVDSTLSASSTNLLCNKTIAEAVAGKLIGSMGGGKSVSVTLNPLYKYLLMAGTASNPTIYFVYCEGGEWYCENGNATFGSFSGNTFTFGSDHSGASYLYKI